MHTYLDVGMTSPDAIQVKAYMQAVPVIQRYMLTYLNVGMTSPDAVQVMANMQAVPVSQQRRHYECHWPQNTTDYGDADVSSRGVAVVLTGVEITQTCCPQAHGVEARIMTGRVVRDLNAAMSFYLVEPTESKVKIVSKVVRIR